MRMVRAESRAASIASTLRRPSQESPVTVERLGRPGFAGLLQIKVDIQRQRRDAGLCQDNVHLAAMMVLVIKRA